MDNKTKNIISLSILLAGLLLGSLFVDVIQLVREAGFSRKNLGKTDIFQVDGKTWVSYDEPIVDVQVVNDDTCADCKPDETLVWLKSVMPTISPKKINYDSTEGKALIDEFSIKSLPAFIMSEGVKQTDLYTEASGIFEEKNRSYLLKTQELGMVPGKFLEEPALNDGDIYLGKEESAVRVFIFADFQCPYCKVFWTVLRSVMKEYGDRVQFVFKNLPLSIHDQANEASLAAYCADEQGKFWEYGDRLFAKQDDWANSQDDALLKSYATGLGMNIGQFNTCLADKKYQTKIDSIATQASDFGISGTPAIFVNNQFKNGVIDVNNLRDLIETQLHK